MSGPGLTIAQCFMKDFLKRNNGGISAYLRDNQLECVTHSTPFNIVHSREQCLRQRRFVSLRQKQMFDATLRCS